MLLKFFKIKYALVFFIFLIFSFSLFSELQVVKERQTEIEKKNNVLLEENHKFRLFALELCQNSNDLSDYLLSNQDCSFLFSGSELHQSDTNYEGFIIDLFDQFVISRDKHASLTKELFSLALDKRQVSRDDYLKTEDLEDSISSLLVDNEIRKYLADQNLFLATSSTNLLELRNQNGLKLRIFQEKWKDYLSLELQGEKQKLNFNAFPALLSIAQKNLANSSINFDLEAFKRDSVLSGETSNNKNILLLGKNEENVDTIMLASVNYQSKQITLISIPRDLFFESRKINSIYRYFGIKTFVEKIEEISGQKISNYVLIDMMVFPKVIDALGGIDFEFKETLIDPSYKTIDNGQEGTLYYPKGERRLSGVEALRVARSRHTTSDFSRAARQQELIKALSDKLYTQKKGDIIFKYIPLFLKNVETDLTLLKMSKLFFNIRDFNIRIGSVISSGNILESKMYNLQSGKQMFILEPREGDWELIKQYISQEINK